MNASVAVRRFGAAGVILYVYTRTGLALPFHYVQMTEEVLGRLRTAVTEAGLWEELATDWLLLDAELMPWSLKASGLLRSQYAAVGAAAGAVFPGRLAAPGRRGPRPAASTWGSC
ncbi:Protein phosphatase OS=Streptomyces albaduncus OX=68172 GN=FHS32_001510 PE=4 SV=1 [Streptomyces griseoloalbus]